MKSPQEQNVIWFAMERRRRREWPAASEVYHDDDGGPLFERWLLEDQHGNTHETNLRPYQVARLFEFDSGVVSGVKIR